MQDAIFHDATEGLGLGQLQEAGIQSSECSESVYIDSLFHLDISYCISTITVVGVACDISEVQC